MHIKLITYTTVEIHLIEKLFFTFKSDPIVCKSFTFVSKSFFTKENKQTKTMKKQ